MYHEFLFAIGGAAAAGIDIQLFALNPARRTIAMLEARAVKAESDLSSEKFETESLASTITMLRRSLANANARADSWFKSYKTAIAERDEARANSQPRDPKTGRMLPKLKAVA